MKPSASTPEQLASMIDHTLLKPYTTLAELKAHCETAIEYHFKTVAINTASLAYCTKLLEGTGILCDATVSFPFGQSTIEAKVFEAADAIEKGAGEIDYVINLVELKSGNWDYIETEMQQIVTACHNKEVPVKVIFENCYLTEAEKRRLCDISLLVKPDFIKTSTGYGSGGATLEDVKLMKACVGSQIQVKASGGIRTVDDALAMVQAGASRIGTSAGVQIVDECRKRFLF